MRVRITNETKDTAAVAVLLHPVALQTKAKADAFRGVKDIEIELSGGPSDYPLDVLRYFVESILAPQQTRVTCRNPMLGALVGSWLTNLKPALLPRAPLRLRLCLDEHGPHWLTLLCQCAWLRGDIVRVNSPPRLRPA